MSGSIPDFSPGETLTAAKLDALAAWIADAEAKIVATNAAITAAQGVTASLSSTLGKQIADNTAGVTSLTNTVTVTTAQQIATLTQSINNMTTSNATLQASLTSALNRLSVLEKATPPPATPGAPTALRATVITTSSITVVLVPPVGGVTPDNYQWQIATPRGSSTWVNGALTGATTTFSGLTSGTLGTTYDIRAISMSTSAGPGGTSLVCQTATAPNPGVVTVPTAPTIISAAASAPNSVTLVVTPGVTGSPATSFQWDYRPTAGNILWGTVGHKDQGGAYSSISNAQQATDLKSIFGTGTVVYRCVGDSSSAGSSGTDLTNLHAVGLEPVVTVAVYPPFSTFTAQADAYAWANTAVAAVVATTPTAKFYEIGNEWTLFSPYNAHTGDGSLPAHWSGQAYFARMVGAVAGAVAAIRAGNPTAKIIGGAISGWTALGLAPAMAASLVNYGGGGLESWSSTHKSSDAILSNVNLTVTVGPSPATNGDIGFASITASTGLYYWEATATSTVMANVALGIGNTAASAAGGTWLGVFPEALGYVPSGSVITNNATVATWASYTTGATICFALDLTHHKLWARVGTAGNWNNDILANQNPATNTGGYTLPTTLYANPLGPAWGASTTGDVVVGKFSLSSWTGTPPAGFGAFDLSGSTDRTWDYTVLHWYNDVVGANQMGMPDNFNGGMNAYALLKGAGKPLFITEFGSSDGNVGTNDTNCGTHLTALMDNFVTHQATTATEPGIAGALIYEMYQQPNVSQTDYFLFNYTSGATGTLAPQGTAVKNWITAHPSAFIPGPVSTGATLTTTTVTGLISSTPYDFRSEGINSAGVGAASATFNVTTSSGSTASPDGTVIPTVPSIIMNNGSIITLVGGAVQRGGVPLYFTSGVVQVGVFNGGKLYQENNLTPPGVWHLDETVPGGWVADTINPFVIAVTPPPVTVTVVSVPSTATIATTDGHVLSITAGGDVLLDGVMMAGSGGSASVAYNSATNTIYALDVGGSGWYQWGGGTWTNCPDPTGGTIITPPPTGASTGVFTVTAAGGFLDPTGKPWSMRGLNAGPQDAVTGFAGCFTQFPGTTAIRLSCNSNNNEDALIRQAVAQYTGRGCVVEVEDHWSGNNSNTAWYTTYATAFKGNPYVFMETPNEPNGGASPQIAVINAIRAAGFTGPIGLQPQGGFDFSAIQTVINSVGRTNIYITPHIYYGGTDPNGPLAYVNADIATSLSFGLFPCIDEFGEAIDGVTLDQFGTLVTSSIIAANIAGRCGAIYWAMDNGNHSNGADSAFLNAAGTALTPTGAGPLKSWLAGSPAVQGTVFYDNFVGTAVNTTKWRRGYFWQNGGEGSGPSGADCWAVGSAGASNPALDTYVVSSNTVSIQVKPTPANLLSSAGGLHWLVGNLNTHDSFSSTYGYWEVTAKMIHNAGVLNAIWLWSMDETNWPLEEIDITETNSNTPTLMHMTTHPTNVIIPQDFTTADESAGLHRYAINWTPSVIEYYYDRTLIRSGATPASIKGPMYLILSTYTKTDATAWWSGASVNPADPWPAGMVVSEVAVWAAKPF